MSNLNTVEFVGAPSNGTTAVFTLTRSGASSGTFRLGVGSNLTTPLAYGANAAAIQAALRALPVIGGSNVTVSGDTSPTVITMAGTLVKTAFGPIFVATNSTNGTVSIAETTPGVTASARTSAFGRPGIDTTTGDRYVNRSTTVNAPNWTLEAARSFFPYPLDLVKIADGTLLNGYTPGFVGRVKKFSAVATDPATTSNKLSTLSLKINTTAVTGGSLALTSANMTPLGNVVNASAITAANAFGASDTLSIVAASTTPFVEGSVLLVIELEADPAP